MYEPGLDRHEWEGEMQALEDEIRESPAEALRELDDLVARMLEETGYVPTEKYAHGPEILAHCRRIAEHYDLYRNACLSTEVTGVEWDRDAMLSQ